MGKRKKNDEAQDQHLDLPKRIKTFLDGPKSSDPSYKVKESKKIVDEILSSPVVLERVRSVLRKHAKDSPKVLYSCSVFLQSVNF